MDPAFVAGERADRMCAFSIEGELVPGAGRGLPVPRSFVPDTGPSSRGPGALVARPQHLDRRVIGEECSRVSTIKGGDYETPPTRVRSRVRRTLTLHLTARSMHCPLPLIVFSLNTRVCVAHDIACRARAIAKDRKSV